MSILRLEFAETMQLRVGSACAGDCCPSRSRPRVHEINSALGLGANDTGAHGYDAATASKGISMSSPAIEAPMERP